MKRRLGVLVLCACAAFASASTSGDAWAGPSQSDIMEARKLVQEGQKAEKASALQEARKAYQASIERNDTANARLLLAHVEEQLGHLVEALEQYRLAVDHRKANFAQKKKAKDAVKRVEPRIPHLTIHAPTGFSGTIRVDDTDLASSSVGTAIALNPGTRIVTARSDGMRPFEKSVVLAEGSQEAVTIALDPLPKEEPKPAVAVDSNTSSGRKTWGYVGVAAGGVGVIVGTAFGLAARKTREDLRGACLDDVCSEAQRDTYDRGKMQANISTVGFVVGGIGLGVGSYLLLSSPGEPEKEKQKAARVTPLIGVGSVGVEGTF